MDQDFMAWMANDIAKELGDEKQFVYHNTEAKVASIIATAAQAAGFRVEIKARNNLADVIIHQA